MPRAAEPVASQRAESFNRSGLGEHDFPKTEVLHDVEALYPYAALKSAGDAEQSMDLVNESANQAMDAPTESEMDTCNKIQGLTSHVKDPLRASATGTQSLEAGAGSMPEHFTGVSPELVELVAVLNAIVPATSELNREGETLSARVTEFAPLLLREHSLLKSKDASSAAIEDYSEDRVGDANNRSVDLEKKKSKIEIDYREVDSARAEAESRIKSQSDTKQMNSRREAHERESRHVADAIIERKPGEPPGVFDRLETPIREMPFGTANVLAALMKRGREALEKQFSSGVGFDASGTQYENMLVAASEAAPSLPERKQIESLNPLQPRSEEQIPEQDGAAT